MILTINLIQKAIFLFVLLICSIKDIQKREISLPYAIFGMLSGVIFLFFAEDKLYDSFLAFLPGIALIGLSVLSEGRIGLGDGVLILMGGFYFGVYDILQWLFYSFLEAALFGGVLIVSKKGNRKTEMPFVPFLFLTAVVLCAVQIVG